MGEIGAHGCGAILKYIDDMCSSAGVCATPFFVHRCVGWFDELVKVTTSGGGTASSQGNLGKCSPCARPASAELRPHILTSHHPPAASRLPPQSAAACSPDSSFHYPLRLSCIERGASRRHVSHRVGRACGSASFPTLQGLQA